MEGRKAQLSTRLQAEVPQDRLGGAVMKGGRPVSPTPQHQSPKCPVSS